MRIHSLIIASIFLVSCISCGNDDEKAYCLKHDDAYCFSFDIRQCRTDLFAGFVQEDDNIEARQSNMKIWLENQNYKIEDIKLELQVYDAVCQACDVCPTGDRYTVYAYGQKGTAYDTLNLLSVTTEDCCDIF